MSKSFQPVLLNSVYDVSIQLSFIPLLLLTYLCF